MKSIDELYERFMRFKVDVCGRNERTIELYIATIKEYCEIMGIKEFDDFVGANAQTVREWLTKLANEKSNAVKTRNKKLSAIKEIYLFLGKQEHYDIDRDITDMSSAKVPKRISKYTTKEDMISLLYATTDLRVRSCIKVIMSTGIRFSELQQLTCTDIERGYAYIIGKGSKERKITFPLSCRKECQRYIKRKRAKIVEKHNLKTDLLFISNQGGKYTLSSFDSSLKIYAKRADIDWYNNVSAHKLRHGFITSQLEKGVPVHIVSAMVGHSNFATTSLYAHANEKLIENAFLEE